MAISRMSGQASAQQLRPAVGAAASHRDYRLGVLLVFLSALMWSLGGAIGRFIESHGRSGVPLYLFYRPGAAPQILPQVLTPSTLTALAG